jgi:hypothetical protein
MSRDMDLRVNAARVDDAHRKSLIIAARRVIYETKRRVDCTAVEDLLKEMSLVPNKVCTDPYTSSSCASIRR